jgi:lipid-binding SYLF domain-containing protein
MQEVLSSATRQANTITYYGPDALEGMRKAGRLAAECGVDKLLSNKVTLGADASVAAGPVGRAASAATDAQLSAEMLSYSRSKGLFAGIDLSGGTLRPDKDANARAYGAQATAKDIALGTTKVTMASEAQAFTDALGRDARATSGKK